MPKILLVYKIDDEIGIESVHANKVGEHYQIDNIPFFANNIAWGDIVKVAIEGGALYFDELVQASGHSTIQIVILIENELETVTDWLLAKGCSWEGSHIKTLVSVDVPPSADYMMIKGWLNIKRDEGVLDYKEACLGIKSTHYDRL